VEVRLDKRDAAKLYAKTGDVVTVGDAPGIEWRVRCAFPTTGGSWVWLER
jgi:hypothetical protein